MSFPHVVSGEMASKLQQYQIIGSIGEGKWAKVYSARRIADQTLVAIKNIKIFEMATTERKECMNEAELLSHVKHPNIIQCYDVFMERNELYMVLELADGGDMAKLIEKMKHQRARFSEIDIWKFIYFISSGLSHMHGKRIMHRDIKPANVYVTKKGEIKLGDLGLGRVFGSVSEYAGSVVGTPYYMSPELIRGESYSFKSDIWSLGCLVYELAMLQVPFQVDKSNLFELGNKIIECQYPPIAEAYSAPLRDLIGRMIQKDSSRRPTADELMNTALERLNKNSSSSSSSSSSQPSSTPQQSLSSPPSSELKDGDPFYEYEDLGVVGRGKYSEVHRARSKRTGSIVAVKKVQIFDMDSDGRREVINEARILQSLPDHPNIIKYIASFMHQNDLYLVLELAESGDFNMFFEEARRKKQYFAEHEIWHYFVQIADAIQAMHGCRVMHRDLKPSNVFLSQNARVVKLGDLGIGRYFSSKTMETFSMVGTPYYMSPEAIANTGYDFKSDIWSLGCLLYEFASLRSPFYSPELNYYTLGNKIKRGEYQALPSQYSETLHRLVAWMIQPDSRLRPDIGIVYQIARAANIAMTQRQPMPVVTLPQAATLPLQNDTSTSSSSAAASSSSSQYRGGGMDD